MDEFSEGDEIVLTNSRWRGAVGHIVAVNGDRVKVKVTIGPKSQTICWADRADIQRRVK